ncbi:DNA internalization-related competence protein ComEC/Rec2 [Deefgea rivuli]|uniref:DNA internalization-related competence protein ComEC/Rec2 n=1 Tax=Deefgea rivuli TaxID=400948 RepID=UPI000482CC82|nr:DNA internalization-related competence protein ComEC/Rec2 [Deefgea rivuli]
MLSRYLLFITCFVLGIITLQMQATLPPTWLAWLGLSLALTLIGLPRFLPPQRSILRYAMIGICSLSLGFAWAQWRAEWRMAQRIPSPLIGKTQIVEGYVSDLPQQTRFGQRFIFTPTQPISGWQPTRIQVYGNDKIGAVAAGERWRLALKLKPVHGAVNPAGFDLESWFLQQNIAATANLKSAERLPGQANALLRLRAHLRERIQFLLHDAPYQGVIVALTIGDQGGIPKAQWQRFAQTGITHLISISGLHITLLAAIAAGMVRCVWRRIPALASRFAAQRAALIAGVITALFYSLLAGMAVPTQRTVLMLLVAALCMWRAKPMAVSSIWARALLAVVVFDPFAVLSVGFWLSFIVVGYLIWSGANRIGEAKQWHVWLSTQWAATLASMPILLLVFGQFPLISPLANALAIPLVSLLITPLALLGLLDPTGTLLHWAERLFAVVDWFLLRCLALPIPDLQFVTPSMGILPLAMLGMALLLLPRGIPARWLGWVMLFPLFFTPKKLIAPNEFMAQVLDVGQGLSVLVQTKNHALLFDTGQAPNGERVLLPVLRQAGIRQLDVLLLSHNDNDHIGAAAILLDPAASVAVTQIVHSLPDLHPLLNTSIAQQRCQTGQHWDWDGVQFALLWLRPDYSARDDNAKGCVLRISNRWHSLLIPADIGRLEEGELLAAGLPATDIVIAPHHGSKNSSSDAFVSALQPQYAVFSAGFMNHFQHPRPEVEARYAAAGAALLRTDQMGAIRFVVGEQIQVQQQRAIAPRYWYTATSQTR